jgi:hypothetical protein
VLINRLRHKLEPNPKLRFKSLKGSRQSLFNFDAVNLVTDPVLVLKGEIPVMLMDQLGYLSCAPTGGEGGWRENWRTALALATKIVVGDNDAPGRELGPRRADLLVAELHYPPDPYKDIDEWVLGNKKKALEEIDRWIREAERSW